MDGKAGMRKGISGEGNRPWVAVWLVLMERAMDGSNIPGQRRPLLKAALGDFLLEFHRHPGKLTAWEIRDYLFRNGELGSRPEGNDPGSHRSLEITIEALAFFYQGVLDRPALAEAARHPFEAGRDWEISGDQGLLDLLREKLAGNGAAGYMLSSGAGQDWSAD